MNRRDFIKKASAVAAVAVAPVPVLAEFASGGVVSGSYVGEYVGESILPTSVAQKIVKDYYQIQRPKSSRKFEFGIYARIDYTKLEAI